MQEVAIPSKRLAPRVVAMRSPLHRWLTLRLLPAIVVVTAKCYRAQFGLPCYAASSSPPLSHHCSCPVSSSGRDPHQSRSETAELRGPSRELDASIAALPRTWPLCFR